MFFFFFFFFSRHFVLTGSMWSVVFLASEACWHQRTEHFLAGLWDSPLTFFSLPLIKNVFYDLLLFGLCVLLGGFPCKNLLTPAAHRRSDLLCLLVEMSERNKRIRCKNITNPLHYFYSSATSADRLSKFTSHYTEITCTWWVGLLANFPLQ